MTNIDDSKLTFAGSAAGGRKPQTSNVASVHSLPASGCFTWDSFSGSTTHPVGPDGRFVTLQIPSDSKPNSSFSADRGIEEIGFEELFTMPISASSDPS